MIRTHAQTGTEARAIERSPGNRDGSATASLRAFLRSWLPLGVRRAIVRHTRWPAVGWVRFGSFRRLRPISPDWGTERGTPIDRYYIDRFVAAHAADIHGRVFEVGDNTLTRRFGGGRVTSSEVLHVAESKADVTIIGNLEALDHVPADTFDCVIVTQTLQCIWDLRAAVATLHRILKPGGTVLATVPGISKVSRYDMDRWGYYWSFTTQSARRTFEWAFRPEMIDTEAHGNVFAAVAFLHGVAVEEVRTGKLDHADPDYQLLITVRATKEGATG